MDLLEAFQDLDFIPESKKKFTRKYFNTVDSINELGNEPLMVRYNEDLNSFDFSVDHTTREWEMSRSKLSKKENDNFDEDIEHEGSKPIPIKRKFDSESEESPCSSYSSSYGGSSYESNISFSSASPDDKIFRIKLSKKKYKKNKKNYISLEKFAIQKIPQDKIDRIRLSGNFLKKSKIYNSGAIILCSEESVSKYKKMFKDNENENVLGLASIKIPSERIGFVEYAHNNIKSLFGDINIKNHLSSVLKKYLMWIKVAKTNDCLLLLVEMDEEGKLYLDIPGGKRMLGESEWECCTRECNEETGFKILDIKEDVDNIKTTFSIDLMKMYVVRK